MTAPENHTLTGPENYAEAQRLARMALRAIEGDNPEYGMRLAAIAQVHATCALAAATALGLTDGERDAGMPPADSNAWNTVAGTETKLQREAARALAARYRHFLNRAVIVTTDWDEEITGRLIAIRTDSLVVAVGTSKKNTEIYSADVSTVAFAADPPNAEQGT